MKREASAAGEGGGSTRSVQWGVMKSGADARENLVGTRDGGESTKRGAMRSKKKQETALEGARRGLATRSTPKNDERLTKEHRTNVLERGIDLLQWRGGEAELETDPRARRETARR